MILGREARTGAVSRRAFLRGALFSAGTALGAVSNPSQALFPVDPRARIAVATYPFRASMVAPNNRERNPSKAGMTLPEFARFVVREFGVLGLEPQDTHFPSTEPTEILKLRAAFDAAGVHTVNIPVDEPVDLCNEDPARRDAGNARYRQWIDIAVVLGSPSIRVWIPQCANVSDLPQAVAALAPALRYAASRNIVVNLENDDPPLASATRTVAAIELARTPYLRALPDFGNALMEGDEKFNAEAVKLMFAHAWNITHVKDAEFIDGKRKTVSLAPLFSIARASGYRGYYSMESDSDHDPFLDSKRLIKQSLSLLQK